MINILTYIIAIIDKKRAVKQKWRIRERTLFYFSLGGGAVGMLLAMYTLRHKVRSKKFVWGIPTIIAVQIISSILIYVYIL